MKLLRSAPALFYASLRKQVLATESTEPEAKTVPLSPRLLYWLTFAFLAVGVLVRITRYAVNGAMWGDEAMLGINVILREFAGLTRMLDHMQTAPILFLWAERAMFLALGSTELALRLLPFIAGLAALFVFWDFARRSTTPLAAVLATGILAVSRWPVSMSATFKPYSTDLFFAALLLNLAQRWRNEPGKLRVLVLLALLMPIALSSSYPVVFVAGAVSLYLLPTAWAHPDRRARGLFVLLNLLMVGTFAVNYAIHIHGQLAEQGRALETFMRNYWADGFPPADPISFVKWGALINTGRLFAYPVGDANGGSVATLLIFLFGIGVVWRSKSRSLLVLLLTPFVLNFLAAVLGKYPYGGCCRLSQHLAPTICLVVGIALAALLERSSKYTTSRVRKVVSLSVLLLLLGVTQIAIDLAAPNRDGISTWSRQIRKELDRHIRPGDQLIVVTDRAYMDETTLWQLTRYGNRLSWGMPHDQCADAPRVWILSNVEVHLPHHLEQEAIDSFNPRRVEVGRAVYTIPREGSLNHPWKFTMICMAKPESAKEPLIFRCSP